MTHLEIEAEEYANAALAAFASTQPEGIKLSLANRIRGFLERNGRELPGWRYQELEWAAAELDPDTRVGSAENPNKFTTDAAKMKEASFSAEFFNVKTLREIGENAKGALGEAAAGITKGLGATALKIGAGIVAIAGAYMVAKKKGWI